MAKTTLFKITLCLTFQLTSIVAVAQNIIPFEPVFNQNLRGDMLTIGNTILGIDNTPLLDNTASNSNIDLVYIDIDGDASTFSSSSADLVIPSTSYTIKYAALYWGAIERDIDHDFTSIKFKGPTGDYIDISGTIIYDRTTDTGTDLSQSLPYACFADVTNLITSEGTYTIANVSSRLGFNDSIGQAAGWSLFIVFEDPTYPTKSITSFNGFSSVNIFDPSTFINVTGFEAISAPSPVMANFAFAVLDGDGPSSDDQILINEIPVAANDRPEDNFFNSSVTQVNGQLVTNRNPNSTNTLGYDTGVSAIPNPNNLVIENGDTSATVELSSSGDSYFPFFFALSLDINNDVLDISESEELLTAIKIYPNPSQDQIHINNPKRIALNTISIYGTTGKLIRNFTKNRDQLNQPLDISNMSSGMYIMVIESEKGTIVKQFTKL